MRNKRILVQCSTNVNKDHVRRESINGVEHIVITSYTLPANIVMNGGLYSKEERDKSFKTLERTLAPVEHPVDEKGNFLSASDPIAIHEFHAGAFNANVRLDEKSDRIVVDKYINVQQALKSEKGRRLLDRVDELENSESPRPIHTSVGLYVSKELLKEPMTNAAGQEYTWSAKDMFFDHDAILLDSVGAAQPHQGVGMAINNKGEELNVEFSELTGNEESVYVKPVTENRTEQVIENCKLSFHEITRKIHGMLNPVETDSIYKYVEEVWDNEFVFQEGDKLYRQSYLINDVGDLEFVGSATLVERNVTFVPVNNHKGDAMKEKLIALLKAANVTVNAEWTEEQVLEAYQTMVANQANESVKAKGDESMATTIAEAVANAMKPIQEELGSLKDQLSKTEKSEKSKMVEAIVNSAKYPDLSAEDLSMLKDEKIRDMYAKAIPSYSLPFTAPVTNSAKDSWEDYKMPE